MGVYFNGRTSVSKTDDLGSIPSAPANAKKKYINYFGDYPAYSVGGIFDFY